MNYGDFKGVIKAEKRLSRWRAIFDNLDENTSKTQKNHKKISKNDLKTLNYCKKQTWKQKLFLIISGAIIGVLNGFFGGGGGMVCVPILEKVLKLENKKAHATAIAVILPLSLVSAFIYTLNGYVQSMPLLVIGSGVVLGGVVGSFALKFLPPKAVRIIFALVMLAGGIKLII